MRKTICKTYLKVFMFLLCFGNLAGIQAQNKQIAVTIDDLPLNGPPIKIKRLQRMTGKLLTVIKKNRIPAVGFVNESLLYVAQETEQRISILRNWREAGVELGNHTFSHLSFKNVSRMDFEDDFIRGETVIRMLSKPAKIRYFRHPFLQMGATRETEESFEKFIGERGYKIVPVTVDTMDWMFLAAYSKALKNKDKALRKKVSDDYLKFVGSRIDSAEQISDDLFGRQIKHILLLHANELNADNFEALFKIFKEKGYQFITVEEALRDSAYQFPDNYTPTSDWLDHWAFSRGKKFETPQPPEYIRQIFQAGE